MPRCLGTSGSVRATSSPQRGRVGQRRPHLLAVDDPLVTVAHRPGGEAGHVRSGAGLAEELAPDLLAREERAEVARPLLVGPVGEDRGRRHAVADDVAVGLVGRVDGAQLALDQALEIGAHPEAPQPDRERHPGEAGVETGTQELHRRRGGRVVVGQQVPEPGADEVLVGGDGVGEGHAPTLTGTARAGRGTPARVRPCVTSGGSGVGVTLLPGIGRLGAGLEQRRKVLPWTTAAGMTPMTGSSSRTGPAGTSGCPSMSPRTSTTWKGG